MNRQGRGSPPQRHSSLPASLHRLMVSGPSQRAQSPDRSSAGAASPQWVDEGREIAHGGAPATGPVHSVPDAGQPLPSLILPHQAPFGELGGVGPAASRHHSRSPALSAVSSEAGASAAAATAAAPTLQPPPRRGAEAGPSSRRAAEGGRGSPASSGAGNYPVAVGSTAYSVTTLSPLRATILPPAVGMGTAADAPVPAPEPEPESASSGVTAGRSAEPAAAAEADEGGGESETEGERTASVRSKRRRRAGTEAGESTTSSSSEHAQAPKSKKTLIACHFCRARKLRCDGQKPSCANCTKRSHPCTYEQQPKRRGPGKTPRGSSSRRRKRPSASAPGALGGRAAGPSNADAAPAPSTSAASAPPSASAVPSPSTFPAGASQGAAVAAAAGQTGPFPMARNAFAFEPQLTGPVPTYPGFAHRPPSASSSAYSAGQLPPFHFLSAGRGMNRSVASDSVRSSNTSNVSSAPSVPESEDGAPEEGVAGEDYMDYTELELEELYGQPAARPGRPEEGGSQ
ncbi:hypothetical protein BD413DRAFT_628753 [Trametes elegans]|nr:hypothetical protein BD413DRAFT_628753 [Trametes elegans]